jgi:Homing endonuclease associated repeat
MRTGPREGFRWSDELIVYAIDLWHRRHLRIPTVKEWERAGPDHPSRQTVQRTFGSWSAAIRAAGFRPRRQGTCVRPWFRHRCPQTGRWIAGDSLTDLPA